MNKLYNIVLLAIALTAIGITAYSLKNYFEFKEINNNISDQDSFIKMEKFKIVIENEQFPLKKVRMYFGLDTLKIFDFFECVQEKTLVYKFSGQYCSSCLDSDIDMIKQIFPDFQKNNRILLLSTDFNPRLKENYFGKRVASYYSECFGFPLDKSFLSVFFIVDKDHVSKMVFITDSRFPELTKIYLETIKNRFFKTQI